MKRIPYILSLITSFCLIGCGDNDDLNLSLPNEDLDGSAFCITIAPYEIAGEEVPYDEDNSRAYNSMTPDRENMIQNLVVLQFDTEGLMRRMDDGKRYLYHNFVDGSHLHGVSKVTETQMPELVRMSSSETMHTCLIANADFTTLHGLLFKDGDEDNPVNWTEFQEVQFDLSFASDTEINDDNTLERGHLTKALMFGYYDGVVSKTGFTLALGRILSRIQVAFSTNNNMFVGDDLIFFAAMHNVELSSYFFVPTEETPHNHDEDGTIYELDRNYIDFTENAGTIFYYTAPHIGTNIEEKDATAMNLWCVHGEWNPETQKYEVSQENWPRWEDKHITIILGNDPDHGDYALNRNTIYTYDIKLNFDEPDFGNLFSVADFNTNYATDYGAITVKNNFVDGETKGIAAIEVEANRLIIRV